MAFYVQVKHPGAQGTAFATTRATRFVPVGVFVFVMFFTGSN